LPVFAYRSLPPTPLGMASRPTEWRVSRRTAIGEASTENGKDRHSLFINVKVASRSRTSRRTGKAGDRQLRCSASKRRNWSRIISRSASTISGSGLRIPWPKRKLAGRSSAVGAAGRARPLVNNQASPQRARTCSAAAGKIVGANAYGRILTRRHHDFDLERYQTIATV